MLGRLKDWEQPVPRFLIIARALISFLSFLVQDLVFARTNAQIVGIGRTYSQSGQIAVPITMAVMSFLPGIPTS